MAHPFRNERLAIDRASRIGDELEERAAERDRRAKHRKGVHRALIGAVIAVAMIGALYLLFLLVAVVCIINDTITNLR